MTLPPRRSGIFHSLAWLTASNAVVKPLWFLFITVGCIRVLGAAEYGTLTAGLALAGMVIALSEVGTSAYLTREGARGPEETGTLFVNILAGRVGIGLLALVVTLLLGYLLGYVEAEVTALLMAGLYVLGFRLNELCKAVYRAFEVFSYEAALLFIERLAVIAAGATGLLVWRNAAGALGGMALGTLASLVGNVWFIHARLSPLHRRALTFGRMRTAYAAALPIGLFFAFSTLLLLTGPVIVEALLGNEAAGLYGAGYKVVEMLMLLPAIVCAPLLPRLSRLFHQGNLAAFRRLVVRTALLLGGAAVAAAAVIAVSASHLVLILAGGEGFAGTVPVLHILAWAYPFMTLAMLMCFALIAADRHRIAAWIVGAAATLNLLLDVVLVPRYGVPAAAAVMLGSQALVAALSTWLWARGAEGTPAPSLLLSSPSSSART